MSLLDNSDFVNLLVKNTCIEDSANWLTAVINQGGRNLRGREKYFELYRSHKADDILSRLQPMQRIYYRFCYVRQIMVMLSNLSPELFEKYISNALENPDKTLSVKMYHSFIKSRIGTGGVVRMLSPHNPDLNVGPTSFNIDKNVFAIPVEKIRLNFFLNVWDFIYMFKVELYDGIGNPEYINYMFPIFGVPIADVGSFSPTYLKNWMIRIQEETKPTEATKQNNRELDNDVDSSYKYDLLEISRLYYESLKKDVDALEKELRDLLQEYAAEFRDNNEKSAKTSKYTNFSIGPRGPRGGSKTKRQRKQRRRKQKSRTKKN